MNRKAKSGLQTNHKKEQEIPKTVLELRPVIAYYLEQKQKDTTAWHKRCCNLPSYQQFRKKSKFKEGKFDLAFSLPLAKAYHGLFDLSETDLLLCTASTVTKSSKIASQLLDILPNKDLLPDTASNDSFIDGLQSLANWQPSKLPLGSTKHSDPVRRWLVLKVAEAFWLHFNQEITIPLMSDILRIGWPDMQDRSVRNMLSDDIREMARQRADKHRTEVNIATARSEHYLNQLAAKTIPNISSVENSIQPQTTQEILLKASDLYKSIPELDIKNRAMSFSRALWDEAGLSEDIE